MWTPEQETPEAPPEASLDLQTEGPIPELPPQEILDKIGKPNAPFVNHPGQYKVVSRGRGSVTVRNMGSGKIHTLRLDDAGDVYTLELIEKYRKVRREGAKFRGRMGYAIPLEEETEPKPEGPPAEPSASPSLGE